MWLHPHEHRASLNKCHSMKKRRHTTALSSLPPLLPSPPRPSLRVYPPSFAPFISSRPGRPIPRLHMILWNRPLWPPGSCQTGGRGAVRPCQSLQALSHEDSASGWRPQFCSRSLLHTIHAALLPRSCWLTDRLPHDSDVRRQKSVQRLGSAKNKRSEKHPAAGQ